MLKSEKYFLKTTIKLLSFFTHRDYEHIMNSYVVEKLKELNFYVKTDEIGNIYAIRGKAKQYPLLNAHMDIIYDVDKTIEAQTEELEDKPIQKTVSKYVSNYTKSLKDELDIENIEEDSEEDDTTIELLKLCSNCENFYDCIALYAQDEKLSYHEAEEIYTECGDAINCASYIYDANVTMYGDSYYNSYDTGYGSSYSSPYSSTYTNSYGSTYSSYFPNYTINYEKAHKIVDKDYTITYNPSTHKIETNKLRALGGDDKCGMAIALQVAKENPNIPMKILFTIGEESGCIGIKEFCKSHAKWFDNVKYSLTIDRRYGDNLITQAYGGVNCSKEFAAEVTKLGILANIMVKNEIGTVADTMYIRELVKECVNMSAGYYNPHSCNEWVSFSDMILIKNWVRNILTNI